MKVMTRKSVSRMLLFAAVLSLLTPLSRPLYGQTTPSLPSAGLQQLAFIPMPNWTQASASYDVAYPDWHNGVMYFADHANFGASAIDMKTLKYLGTIVIPGCPGGSNCAGISGILVAPDVQKLIVTDRSTHIFIYDLRVVGQPPVTLNLPAPSVGADELDYDPINQRAYIGITTTGFGEAVVDVANSKLLGIIATDTAPEQSRWNPVDGIVYLNLPGSGKLAEIDPAQGSFGTLFDALPYPTGCANGLDIDPVNDTAWSGCSAAPSQIVDLHSGATVAGFPLTFGVDIGKYNPRNRRFYAGVRENTAITPCTKDTASRWAYLGVFSNYPTNAQFIGGSCTGLGGRAAAVDPINNNIYAQVQQYPPDPNSNATGQSGILVFHDPAPDYTGTSSASTEQASSSATLTAIGGSGVSGTVSFTLRRRNMNVDGSLSGLPASSTSVWMVVETTIGHEAVPCGVDSTGKGYCSGDVLGDPLVGAPVNVASGGLRVAGGNITSVATTPTYISIDSATADK